jgi:hypothetical protein
LFDVMAEMICAGAQVHELDVGLGDTPLLETGLHGVVARRVAGEQDLLALDAARVLLDRVVLVSAHHQHVGLRLVVGDPNREKPEARRPEYGRHGAGTADIP